MLKIENVLGEPTTMEQASTSWIDEVGAVGLVSIVIPTLNRSPLLRETLQSLLGQSYRPMEIIIVGDGVEDDTEHVVAHLASQAAEGISIRYFGQARAGGPAARNRGARHTTGEFLIFMDDDDLAAPDFVSSRVQALQESDANMAFGAWRIFVLDEQGNYHLQAVRGLMPPGQSAPWPALLQGWDLLLQGSLLRRSLVSRVGPWDEQLHKSQDLDYKARLLALDCRPQFCEGGIIYYRLHDQSISGDVSDTKLQSYVDVLEHIEQLGLRRPDYEQTRGLLAEYFWNYAFWLYAMGDFARGFGELQRAQKHAEHICRRKGSIPRWLDRIGLEIMVGPGYFFVSRIKKSLGLSRRKFSESRRQLLPASPTSVC